MPVQPKVLLRAAGRGSGAHLAVGFRQTHLWRPRKVANFPRSRSWGRSPCQVAHACAASGVPWAVSLL